MTDQQRSFRAINSVFAKTAVAIGKLATAKDGFNFTVKTIIAGDVTDYFPKPDAGVAFQFL